MIDWNKIIGDAFGFNKTISDKNTIIDSQSVQIQSLNQKVTDLTYLVDSTKKQDKQAILDLETQLESLERIYAKDPMEDHWNNRYPKINQNYSKYENKLTYSIDVRDFFTPYDSNIPTVSGATNDEKALNGLKYVINNVTYVPDKTNFGYDEYWAWAFETLTRKKGDCEDGAILLANILVNSGVPYWRVRLNAGSVNGGGHCYLTYCRETDNQFVVLDWCYWPNSKPVAERLLHSQEQNYDDPSKNFGIWFSWNQKYCFGAMQTMQGMPKYFGK